ncbi:MAG: Stk1 family PASTA domain-containing Ser/Thr kinase [Chloroflexota bacterium]|nr:MAG: Stk1 family PASTA domain-containing Ser/Thr kinase [Chloroflexota bacterium]
MLGGRYRLEEQIGRGGMSVVYRAFDTRLSRAVAVKVMAGAAAEDRSFQARFSREARTLAVLSHPGIATVYDAGQDGDQQFLVMEYLPWPTLRQILSSESPIPPTRAQQLIMQLAEALGAAHQHGLVHCDVKPENLLVGPDDRVKLVDFGIAQAATATGAWDRQELWGTAAYLAPEQVEGQSVDERTDVYALGLILYELLAGKLPFQGRTPAEVALARVTQSPAPLTSAQPSAPTSLCRVVDECLQRSPEERYQSMDAVRAALAGDEAPAHSDSPARSANPLPYPTAAHSAPTTVIERPSSPDPSQRPMARRRVPLLLLALLVLIGAAVSSAAVLNRDTTSHPVMLVAPPERTVPELVGLTTAEAQERATSQHLLLTYAEPQYSAETPAGRIAAQLPEPDTLAREGATISLTVSLGPRLAVVPNLVGRTQNEVASLLQKENLQLGTTRSQQSQSRTGTIIEQSPPAGQAVAPESNVDLVVSSGTPVRVPRVMGLSRKDAEKALRSANLTVGEVRETRFLPNTKRDKEDREDRGIVIGQDPLPGTQVAANSAVILIVLD